MLGPQLIACRCLEDKLGLEEKVNDLSRWVVNTYKAITLLDAYVTSSCFERTDLLNLIFRIL